MSPNDTVKTIAMDLITARLPSDHLAQLHVAFEVDDASEAVYRIEAVLAPAAPAPAASTVVGLSRALTHALCRNGVAGFPFLTFVRTPAAA